MKQITTLIDEKAHFNPAHKLKCRHKRERAPLTGRLIVSEGDVTRSASRFRMMGIGTILYYYPGRILKK